MAWQLDQFGVRYPHRIFMPPAKHLYPKAGPRSTESRGEVAVYDAFASDMPTGWRGWHSLKLRTEGKWEGEGDFVIAIPDAGLLVLEVKSGEMLVSDGSWYQNGRRLDKAPRDQAQSFVRNLVKHIVQQGGSAPPYGVACGLHPRAPTISASAPPFKRVQASCASTQQRAHRQEAPRPRPLEPHSRTRLTFEPSRN